MMPLNLIGNIISGISLWRMTENSRASVNSSFHFSCLDNKNPIRKFVRIMCGIFFHAFIYLYAIVMAPKMINLLITLLLDFRKIFRFNIKC